MCGENHVVSQILTLWFVGTCLILEPSAKGAAPAQGNRTRWGKGGKPPGASETPPYWRANQSRPAEEICEGKCNAGGLSGAKSRFGVSLTDKEITPERSHGERWPKGTGRDAGLRRKAPRHGSMASSHRCTKTGKPGDDRNDDTWTMNRTHRDAVQRSTARRPTSDPKMACDMEPKEASRSGGGNRPTHGLRARRHKQLT